MSDDLDDATGITMAELLEAEGMSDVGELLDIYGTDSVMPALCNQGCQVEPDGRCEHGHPSLLLHLGYI